MGVSPLGVRRRDRGADIPWARLSEHAQPPQSNEKGCLFGGLQFVATNLYDQS